MEIIELRLIMDFEKINDRGYILSDFKIGGVYFNIDIK